MSMYTHSHDLVEKQRSMSPSYRKFRYVTLYAYMIIGALLVIAPVILLFVDLSILTWFFLGAIPFGGVLAYRSYHQLQLETWVENHLSQTQMHNNQIRYSQWNPHTKMNEENQLEWSQIQTVYYGKHMIDRLNAYVHKAPSGLHTMPVIHLVYQQNMKDRVHSVPFYEEQDAEAWIERLAPTGKLKFTTIHTVGYVPEAELLRKLRMDRDQEAFSHTDQLSHQYDMFLERVEERMEADEYDELTEEEEEELLALMRAEDEQERRDSSTRNVGLGWLVFVLQWGVAYFMGRAAESGSIESEQWLMPSIIIMLGCALFYTLVKRLLWKHMLFYAGGTLLNFLGTSILLGGSDETTVIGQMHLSLSGSAILCAVLVWIPYILIYPLRAGRDGRRQDESISLSHS